MKAIDPHLLLENEIKKIDITGTPAKSFNAYKKLLKNNDASECDFFIAGFFLGTNNQLRQKYLKELVDDKFDFRIN